jgi:hypothetical protein
MTDTCPNQLPYKAVGPYNQTLFLGCSITNFNISLGWGAEASTLTVNLLDDKAHHPSSPEQVGIERELIRVTNQTEQLTQSSRAINVDQLTGGVSPDGTKTFHRTIAEEMLDQEKSRFAKNKRLNYNPQVTGNDNIKDDGKVCWSAASVKKFWTYPDLGFLGMPNKFDKRGYDIIGTPVLFRFDDLVFGGMINSWKNVGSQGGWPTYEVEVRSFASLLNGSQIIIDGYAGAVASVIANTSNNPTGRDVCVPHAYVKKADGNSYNPYNGSIAQGNLPNVFNIYGHLESGTFGSSGRTDRGIPAIIIYNTLISMLGPGTDESHGPFNPYGALLSRTITDMDGNAVDPYETTYKAPGQPQAGIINEISLHDLGICRNRFPQPASNGATPDASFRRSMFKLDISGVPAPPSALYMQGPTMSILQFITEICDGAGVDFFIDFDPTSDPTDDYAGTLVVRTVSRRNQPDRQVIKNIVDSMVDQTTDSVGAIAVSSYNYGQEFNDQNTRVMYVGGKQRRLIQVKATPLASKQSTLIFDPFANNGTGSFISYSSLGQPTTNQVREPNLLSTRSYKYKMAPGGGSVVAESQVKKDFPGAKNSDGTFSDSYSVGSFTGATYFSDASTSRVINRGNYNDAINLATIERRIVLPCENHPYWSNLISPYFGIGSNGLGREVYFDPGMGQMQVIFDCKDILDIISSSAPGDVPAYTSTSPVIAYNKFMVLENELRAASVGFGEWMTYCFDNYFTTDIQALTYKIFTHAYGQMGAKPAFLNVVSTALKTSINKFHDIRNGRPHRNNLNTSLPYVKVWHKNLASIHEFFQKIAQEYYGKKFMIRLPLPRLYQDSSILQDQTDAITASLSSFTSTFVSNTVYIKKGSGKIYADWELSPEGAWEEPGNWIDDSIMVGSQYGLMMVDEEGKIPPMIGYNASSEYDYKSLYIGGAYAAQEAVTNPTRHTSMNVRKMIAFEMNRNGKSYFYPSIHHSLPPDQYITLPYKQVAGLALTTAHGKNLPEEELAKMYVKASLSADFVFLKENLKEPRAIMSISSPVFIGANKNSTDNNIHACMMMDAISKYANQCSSVPTPVVGGANETKWGGLRWTRGQPTSDEYQATLQTFVDFEEANLNGNRSDPDDPSIANIRILDKAAVPCFAAIPVLCNLDVYGPWINHPGSLASGDNGIFARRPDPYRDVENLIGGVKVKVDEGLVPWRYGGMDSLDAAVLDQIFEDVNYQQINEQGSIQVPGFMLINTDDGMAFNVGDALQYAGYNNGPVINNIQVQVGEGGITTTYNMRTYVRKLGFFNKENADRIKLIGQESFKRRKEIAESAYALQQKLSPGTNDLGARQAFSINPSINNPPPMMRTSPFTVLAGQAYSQVNFNSSLSDLKTQLGFSPSWHMNPYILGTTDYTPTDMIRQLTYSSLYDVEEAAKELPKNYDQKSFMSLDGLLSPISFYPTEFCATYHTTKYPREACPFCKGTGRFTYVSVSDDGFKNALAASAPKYKDFVAKLNGNRTSYTEECKFCEPLIDKAKRAFVSASPKETTPPYVIASGDDLTLVNNLRYSGLSGNPIINQMTLNPILTSIGEFSCFQNRQSGDLTAHSIEIIGDGLTPPEDLDFLQLPYSNNLNKRYSQFDIKYIEFAQDHPNLNMDKTFLIANNMKSFGLRGPLMVHGWGYDLEGYPVPNASGQPLIQNGALVSGVTEGGSVNGLIYKNQIQKSDGTWTKPYKENTFYKGWGQFPGTWPVGPVDLRWDDKARVWTVGANYKPVWIQIETDLIENQPVRGVMIEDASNNILPSGLRKLVYVKDVLGLNPAPRGAQIYCKYDSDNGFYEPIYNRPYITSGIIQNATSVDIYKVYDTGNARYNATYKNPLNFNTSNGDVGLFVFINKNWVLQSARC